MSTLATNKLGTLSGSADMSLPSSRPSSTKQGFLDASGNLSFGEASVSNVPLIVTDDDGKVGKVLIDNVCSTGVNTTEESTVVKYNNSNGYYGYSVGIHNAPDAIKTNYLADGNVRAIEIDFMAYVNGNSLVPSNGMWYFALDSNGSRLWTENQDGGSYGRTYENADSGGSVYSTGSTSYSQPSNNSTNDDWNKTSSSYGQGCGIQGKVLINCGVSSTYQTFNRATVWRNNYTSGDMYPMSNSGFVAYSTTGSQNSGRAQGNNAYNAPWASQGGCLFSGGYSGKHNVDYFSAVAYAYIKPTTVV